MPFLPRYLFLFFLFLPSPRAAEAALNLTSGEPGIVVSFRHSGPETEAERPLDGGAGRRQTVAAAILSGPSIPAGFRGDQGIDPALGAARNP